MTGSIATGPIAVIEDDGSAKKALGRLLNAAGFEPALFGSAEAFLASQPDREWSCLIVDVQLPGMSGIELQLMLRAKGSTAPIIVITAHGSDAIREQAEQAGCAAFLAKPFNGDAVLTLLASLASRSRA